MDAADASTNSCRRVPSTARAGRSGGISAPQP
jgi:hypothetical protein